MNRVCDKLPFTRWSRQRIAQGRKWATTRTRKFYDPRVVLCFEIELGRVRDEFWQIEGADSPEEYEKVWRSLHRGHYRGNRWVYIHFGDFREGERMLEFRVSRNLAVEMKYDLEKLRSREQTITDTLEREWIFDREIDGGSDSLLCFILVEDFKAREAADGAQTGG